MHTGGVNQQEAEQALMAWASIERDELVRAAHEAGVSKNRIHTITGIARTTIDRILEPPMPQTQTDRLVNYLTRFTAQWPRQGFPPYLGYSPSMASAYSAQQIAEALFADAEFRALKLGTFLNTPDGQLLAAAVEALTPPPYRDDIALLVEALQLAAKMQHDAARETFVKGVVVALGVGAIAAALANGNS
jgi:hypothetical protein